MSYDPYQPPAVVQSDAAFAAGSPLALNTKPGTAASIAVGALVGIEVLTLILVNQPLIDRADVMAVLVPLQTVTRILPLAAIVSFLIWQHGAVTNLGHFAREGVTWSPGVSVGYWFIPILSLIHGHNVASEVWRASDPADAELDPRAWKVNTTPAFITAWWIAYLVSRLAWIVTRYEASGVLAVLVVATSALAGVLMIRMIRKIDQRQVAFARRLFDVAEKRHRRRLKKLRRQREAAEQARREESAS